MAVVAIAGGPGAPGATSAALALLLGWPLTERRRVLLVEADPDGGAVLAGALRGEVQADKGLRNLPLSDRRGRLLEEMWDQCIDLSPRGTGDRLLLPGLSDPAQAQALVYTWEPLAEACQALDAYGCDVLVDLGRSGASGPSSALVRRADAVVAVLRSTLRGLSAARPRVAALAAELKRVGAPDALALLLVREGPYAATEISRELGAPVVGLLPFAPKDARTLSDGGGRTSDRRFQRSELLRAARSTADELRALTSRRRLVTAPVPPLAAGAAPQGAVSPQPPAVPYAQTAPQVPSTAPLPSTPYGGATPHVAMGPHVPTAPFAPTPGLAPAPSPAAAASAAPGSVPAPPASFPGAPLLHAVPAPHAPQPFAPAADATRLGYREAQAPHLTQPPTPPTWPTTPPLPEPTHAHLWPGQDPAASAGGPGPHSPAAVRSWPGQDGGAVRSAGAASQPAAAVTPWPVAGDAASADGPSAHSPAAVRPWSAQDGGVAARAGSAAAHRPLPAPGPEAGARAWPGPQVPGPGDGVSAGGAWPRQGPAAWAGHGAVGAESSEQAARPWSAHAGTAGPWPGAEPQPPSVGDVVAPRGAHPPFGDAAPPGGAQPPYVGDVVTPGAAHAHTPRGAQAPTLRELMDLAAAAELGAGPAPVQGPAHSPIGPVTPGQAARLQAVQTEPQPAVVVDRGAFTPPHMVVMPPLAEHAPRPPAPEEIRPTNEGPEHGGEGVARVR